MDYTIRIDEFEGPLDLLLHLIKKNNLDINEISITLIVDQYLDYIKKQEELNINVASSYLVMACELMEIKSSSLLPSKNIDVEDDYEEDPKQRLIDKLIEYEKYKEVSSVFKELELKRKDIFVKSPENINNYFDEDIKIEKNSESVDLLIEAFKNFINRKELDKPLNTKITNKEYSVKKRKIDIRNKLLINKELNFTSLFEEKNKPYIIVTFLSILEMSKEDEIIIKQDNNFSDILIELRNK